MSTSRRLSTCADSISHSHQQPVPGPSSMPSTFTTISAPLSSPIVVVQGGTPFTVLKTLHKKVKNLPKSIPIATKTGPLAGYCCDSRDLTKDIADNADVWEVWDGRLNVLILHSIPDLYPLITRGKYGLIALVQLMEHLVRDRNIDEGLLEGKVGRVIQAIDRYLRSIFFYFRFVPLLMISMFSVSASSKIHRGILSLPKHRAIQYPSLSQRDLSEKLRKEGGDHGSLRPLYPLSKFFCDTRSVSHSIIILLRWEAAREWKGTNSKGTAQEFDTFWESIQCEKDKLQVVSVPL